GAVPPARLQRGLVLPVAEQVRRHERARRQAPEGAGDREQPAQEAAGGVNARERGDPRGAAKKVVTAPARRALVRHMIDLGLSERRALAVVRMSASAYRYQPRLDRNGELRERILALAQRYKRYGVGMIYLKLRQAGMLVNYK